MTYTDNVEAFARRHSWNIAKARERAEALIEVAIERALIGAPRFDLLPPELEEEARRRWRERLNEAPGDVEFVSGTTGVSLR